jgi:glucose-6-phosphate dehydrogenase assembly protein OpcA
VNEDIWSAQDTNPDAIEAALRELLRERHAANAALAPARVLNLIVIVDREWKGEIANRLERAGRYTPSRTVLCAVEEGRERLDAVAAVHYDEPHDGIGVMHEQVEIELGPSHLPALRTIVDPVLVSEIPTMCWSPHGHEDAVEELLPLLDVILLDSDDQPDPREAFERACAVRERAYVVDLAWLRTTPWRERLAASFDLPLRLAALRSLALLEIRHRGGSEASALLLAGWLASRLHWERGPLRAQDDDDLEGSVRRGRGEGDVAIALRQSAQEAPGLAGVTVCCVYGTSLSLQRGHGGLDAAERMADGELREWKILGASRGEGGILGEGVRQALLREPTYGAALEAARDLCPV